MTKDLKAISKESLTKRTNKLFNDVVTSSGAMHRTSGQPTITHDALLDSFIFMFDECSKDALKKDINISYFVNKFKSLSTEIRALRLSISDFDLSNTIGRGQYGDVRVAKEKATGDVYAIKTINKTKTLLSASGSLFEEERDILYLGKSHWLTSLQYAFQDAQNLYLVMEYLPGGDLLSLMEREGGKLSVENARFYLGETIVAVDELHRLGYVHRDVKPENLLLDRLGHIKLADFGSAAKICADGRVVTAMPAGTPDYIAPEVLKSFEADSEKNGYGCECDYWSIGVLAYTLVFGCTPFTSGRTSVTYSRIMSHSAVHFPDAVDVTDSLKDLINSLLRPAANRLDYKAVKKHLFFIEIDFDHLREVVPPFVPVVSSPDDTSNFGPVGTKTTTTNLTPRDNNKEFSGKQLPFVGYTYSGLFETKKKEMEKKQIDTQETAKKNQALLTKLLSAQQANRESDAASEVSVLERKNLQRELLREKQNVQALRKHIEQEMLDRQHTEQKALMMVRQAQQQHDREILTITTELQAKLDYANDCLTQAHTHNNEMTSRCDRAEAQVSTLRVELDQVKGKATLYMDKIAKGNEIRRRSVTDIESKLDKIQNQEERWRNKFNAEVLAKQNAIKDAYDVRALHRSDEAKWEAERAVLEEELRLIKGQLREAQAQISATEMKLNDTFKVDNLQSRLDQELKESARLKAKIAALETELSNTTQTFLEHETLGQKSSIRELEAELKSVTEDKVQLQVQVQTMCEKEEENRVALVELEKILETLEREVKKLEQENADLKMAEPSAAKLLSKAEINYQHKIESLEQQVKKLDGQLNRRIDCAIAEKDLLRETQAKLRKAERELSDASRDVRLAKYEAKSTEETLAKLREEVKTLNDRLKKAQEEREVMMAEETSKVEKLRAELKACQDEVQALRGYKGESLRLTEEHKTLQGEYSTLAEKLKNTSQQLISANSLMATLQNKSQAILDQKKSIEATVEELQRKIAKLEVNNAMLKETCLVLEGQLEDYEEIVSDLNANIEIVRQENGTLNQTVTRLERELTSVRNTYAEEKSTHAETKLQLESLRNEVNIKTDIVDELRKQIEFTNETCDNYSAKALDRERQVRELESELLECDREVQELQAEVIELKKELSSKLSMLYMMKEKNAIVNQELDERNGYVDTLNERIEQLEKALNELDCFHKQREIKDKDHIGQLNKLISYLQTKLDEKKKKQTFADKLFGGKKREPPSPQAPMPHSPRNVKSTSEPLRKKALVTTPRKGTDSPRTAQAMTQLASSPTKRMNRQMSLPRMHHKIPHRFKPNQIISATTKCAACRCDVIRSSKASRCTACPAVVHPSCAVTAPKTCGLPVGLAQHYVQSVEKIDVGVTPVEEEGGELKGWISIITPSETTWKRRYIKLVNAEVHIFESEPSSKDDPSIVWPLVKPGGHTMVSADVTHEELPTVASMDLPFVFKVVSIPQTTCWPNETHYLLASNQSEKTKWITALESAIPASMPRNQLSDSLTQIFSSKSDMGIICAHELSQQVVLLGTRSGLFAVQSNSSSPVQIHGVTSVHAITVAESVNLAVMVVGEERRLLTTDYRLLESNASGSSCSNPGITTAIVSLEDEDDITVVRASDEINGVVYLAVATAKNVHVLRWCPMSCEFVPLRTLPSCAPVTCVMFMDDVILVGSQTFQTVSLNNFSVKEVFNTRVSHGLLRMRSYPLAAFRISVREVLLCFREFGVFVDEEGRKSRPDLKWAQPPLQFGFTSPLLYIVSRDTVEVVRLSLSPEATSDDVTSIATTATLCDNATVHMDNASLIGTGRKGVYITNGSDVLLVEGRKVCKDNVGSCATLDRVTSVGQFSFTSSLMGSLDGSGSDSYPSSPEKIQHTEL